ncbi:MAG TPA: SapC family protein [Burkholderiales bacterium]|nr:SapC family protein [Burkholderiales bacterium]
MPTLFFYEKPAVLNRDAHRKLKIRSVPSFAYAAKVNSVPLTGNEFAAAARQLPIVFVQDANGNPSPIVLLGLRRDENLFVEADGRWNGGYVPAFVRRYPFVLIEKETAGEYMVGIDEAFPGFNADDGEPMFGDDGAEGPALKRALEFLNVFQTEARRTQEFMAQLKRLDLLIPRVINVSQKGGSKYTMDGFSVVDEARLVKLDEKEAGNLLRTGFMGWIYMHLLSMHNIPELSSRLDTRIAA